jgi:multidrug resistance efflux pump
MILFLLIIYVAVLFVLVKMKVLPNSSTTWLSTIVWFLLMLVFLFIPMQWGAPSGPVRIMTRAVQIVPNVTGQVINIPVRPNTPVEKGELLFQIDPQPFQIALDLAKASLVRAKAQAAQDLDALSNAEARLSQVVASATLAQSVYDDKAELAAKGVASASELEKATADLDQAQGAVNQAQSDVSRAKAELGAVTSEGVVGKVAEAQASLDQVAWELEQTSVHAPGSGYVTNLALSVGQRVSNSISAPAMVFIDTSEEVAIAQIDQIYLRHLRIGQPVELTFKVHPGKVTTGTVEKVFDVASGGQVMVSGTVAAATDTEAEPFLVRIRLDDPQLAKTLPPGAVGSAAIFTDSAASTHFIRKIMLRMEGIMNYIKPTM